MEVEFQNISYEVRTFYGFGPRKQILHNVSGKFEPGELVGILGPSGAGKTSLLHILSGYKTKGVSGALLINDEIRDERWFRRRSCYITQEDTLPPFVTVFEALKVAARLKRGGDSAERQRACLELLDYLGLRDCADTRTEQLSGGQRKRTAVALELIGGSSGACFLDEPCSGLDDVAAVRTQKLLRKLAAHGRTVAVTVHQPPASVLALYHRLYIVADGRCVFHGSPTALVAFLSHHGYNCPITYNPADFIMELIDNKAQHFNILAFSGTVQNGLKPFALPPSEKVPEILVPPVFLTDEEKTVSMRKESLLSQYDWVQYDGNETGEYATSKLLQFWILLQRIFLESIRHRKTLGIQALHYILNALLLGSVFYDNAEDGSMMFNHLKFCVGIVMFYSHSRLFIPVILFPPQVKAAKKEHFNRWYGTLPFYIATMIATLPVHIFFNCLYMSIVYYLSGLPRELWKFSMYLVIGNGVSLSTEGMGLAVGSICSQLIGVIIAPSVTVPFLCLAIYGFDFAHSISLLMKIVMRTSPMRCGLAAFIIVTFGYGRKPLRCDDLYCHFADPKVLLNYLDADDSQLWIELGAIFANILFYRILAYIALRKRFST